ncbi:MAG: hypothetical protein KDD84_16675, partial [Caldilineaceae bacterium]|nr:hypothetical protein [Caldilineaceae bacterium]
DDATQIDESAEAPVYVAGSAPIWLKVTTAEVTDGAGIDVNVLVTVGADRFGAASFELRYDPMLLTPESCTADPGEAFDMVICNLDYAPGIVRFNAVSTGGAAGNVSPATLHFQRTGDSAEETPSFTLTPDSVTDVDGKALDWRIEAGNSPDAGTSHSIFLPGVSSSVGSPSTAEAPQGTLHSIFLPSVVSDEITPNAQAPAAPQTTESSPNWIFLPGIDNQSVRALESSADEPKEQSSPEITPSPEPTAAPVKAPDQPDLPPAEPEPSPLPQDEAWRWDVTPVAVLPSPRTWSKRRAG